MFTKIDIADDVDVKTIDYFSKLLYIVLTNKFTTNIRSAINSQLEVENFQILDKHLDRYHELNVDVENMPAVPPTAILAGPSK